MKYGDLVVSEAHIPQARGPYLFLAYIKEYAVCIALDGSHSINIPIDKCVRFPASAGLLRIALERAESTGK
jgi:hypothetical protein